VESLTSVWRAAIVDALDVDALDGAEAMGILDPDTALIDIINPAYSYSNLIIGRL
jgi:hypothetical protein